MFINIRHRVLDKNKILNQTVEVLDQTDVIQDLIDTYKPGGFNYVFNPCHMIPKLEALSEQSEADAQKDSKFNKPLWFIPPEKTDFISGKPQYYPRVSKKCVEENMRKSLAGLLRLSGFKNATNSSLILFVDAVDEFLKQFLDTIKSQVHINNDRNTEIDILTLEKSYNSMTKNSLLSLHNYYKNEMIRRNRSGISELQNNFQDYEKIIQMNQKP